MSGHKSGFSASATASAKINLALHVTAQRADHYHVIDSWVCFADYGDKLRVESEGSGNGSIRLHINGPFSEELANTGNSNAEDNLVYRAAQEFKSACISDASAKSDFPDLLISLEKNLPIASGIGGGSADAAALLVLLQQNLDADGKIDLNRIAIRLGADVPMCLDKLPKRVQGIGEHIEAIKMPVSLPLVLVNPLQPLSTPLVFSRLKNRHNDPLPETLMCSSREQAISMLGSMRNDLQSPAISLTPQITDLLNILDQQTGCQLTRMSGSGATCFGIFDTVENSRAAMIRINAQHPTWWVKACRTIPSSDS